MRKLLAVLAIAFFIASCNQDKPAAEEKKDSATTETKKVDNTSYPYKASYSSAFEMGKPENSKVILDIWKAFEENKLSDTRSLWADSVTMQFDGFTFHGTADSALKSARSLRLARPTQRSGMRACAARNCFVRISSGKTPRIGDFT